jgi:glycosyltransferase involved in cell wall biosynthesis
MEASLGQRIIWVDGNNYGLKWSDFAVSPPNIFIQGGYFLPSFNALGRQVRAAGGRVVLASDHNWTGCLRQNTIERVRAVFKIKPQFDAVFVPGVSAEKYYRKMFFPDSSIYCGLYGADKALFNSNKPLRYRERRFVFIGQLIKRKNLVALIRAFTRFSKSYPDWSLSICGSGNQRNILPFHSQIRFEKFLQPTQLASLLADSRCLVLPSLSEHWGLVVHEASLSGCALALSKEVGAAADLACPQNAVIFSPGDEKSIEHTLSTIASWDDTFLNQVESTSKTLAENFGPHRFADAVDRILQRLIAL